MKTLKFRKKLAKLILDHKKTTTWRLFDDKNISVDDEVSFVISETNEEFAKAKIVSVTEKRMGNLEEKDWEGHERFSSNEEMYKTYETYYGQKVNRDTLVKIIRFILICLR